MGAILADRQGGIVTRLELTMTPSRRDPVLSLLAPLRQQIRHVRPRAHPQFRPNPLQRHRRLGPQPPGDVHLAGITLRTLLQIVHRPAEPFQFRRHHPPRSVRQNVQKAYDASSAIFTMPKKFVTVDSDSAPSQTRRLAV